MSFIHHAKLQITLKYLHFYEPLKRYLSSSKKI